MELKLDVHALNALFPEGTEARLKLQQCVLEEFSRRHFKSMDNLIRKNVQELQTVVDAQLEPLLKEHGWTKWYSSWKLPPAVREELASKVNDLVRAESNDMIREAGKEAARMAMSRLDDTINHTVDRMLEAKVTELLNREADETLKGALRSRLLGLLDKGAL